jgi:hypothetical protein
MRAAGPPCRALWPAALPLINSVTLFPTLRPLLEAFLASSLCTMRHIRSRSPSDSVEYALPATCVRSYSIADQDDLAWVTEQLLRSWGGAY